MTEPVKRKLIEVALPLESISAEASLRKRKAPAGYPTSIHRWWAQIPIAASRAVLFASLVDDPSSDPDRFPTEKAVEDERTRLFAIIERLIRWENSTNESVLDEARTEIRRSVGSRLPIAFDPFSGGGSIPLEAQRLGLATQAGDLNPVAVLITKALVEFPRTFANCPPVNPELRGGVGGTGTWKHGAGLAQDIRTYGAWMASEARRRVGQLCPKVPIPHEQGGGEADVIAWLWARTVTCPNPACRVRMPLVRSFVLSTRGPETTWARPQVDKATNSVSFEVAKGGSGIPRGTADRKGARCMSCGSPVSLGHVRMEGQAGRMGVQLMAIVAGGRRGRLYLAPTKEQEAAAQRARPSWVPEDLLATHPQYMAPPRYGLTRFRDLFTDRQLAVLGTLTDLVQECRDRALSDSIAAGLDDDGRRLADGGRGAPAYADAIATYLAFVISRVADYGNALASWRPKDDAMRALFGRGAMPMVWDFAEGSPFGASSSGIGACVDVVARCLEFLAPAADAEIVSGDASVPQRDQGFIVSSDPPYYDNVPYADLSDFFYVWLRRSLGPVFPGIFQTLLAPKSAELVADIERYGGREAARQHFERGLEAAFSRMRDGADPTFPLTIYYAYRQSETDDADETSGVVVASTGWETMLESLIRAGLVVIGTWPIRTAGGNRMRSHASNALASAIVFVCRRKPAEAGITTRKDLVAQLKRELPDALRTLRQRNTAPVDFAQSAIGPGMAVFSRYAKVLESDGSSMTVRTALALINQTLDEILAEQEGEFDADTRWAIAWFEQFGLKDAEYGSAETLSKAKNTSVAGLVEAGIVAAARGRVRLLAREEYSSGWDPASDGRLPAWEATQRLVHVLLTEGEVAAAQLLVRLGSLGEAARDLAYRLYQLAERKGWSEEARAYNALVVAWSDLGRVAETPRVAGPTQANLGFA